MDLRRPHPHSLSPLGLSIAGWGAFVIAGAIFLSIAWDVATRSPLVALDARVAIWLHTHGTPFLTAFFFGITHVNSVAGVCVMGAAFAAVLARKREWYWMLTLGAALGGGMLLNVILKLAYERLRPSFDDPLLALQTYSFPSGHTAGAVLFYGVLAAFLVSRLYDWRRRAACVLGAVAAVALVALSRIYLGAHYLSDVLAAACSSLAWLALCLAAGHALVRKKLRLRWIGAAIALFVLLAGAALLPLADWTGALEDRLEAMGLVQGLLLFLAVNVVGTLLFVPAWIFPVAAGAVFGVGWGLAVALASATLSAVVAFLIARYGVHERLERTARKNKTFKAVDAAIAKEPWKIVALLRMSPVLPSGLKSYFLGLTRVPLSDYAAATTAGMLPGTLLKVYVGHAGRGALSGGDALSWAVFAAGVAATIALTLLVDRSLRRRLAL